MEKVRRTKPVGAYDGKESSFQASAIKLVRAIAGPDVLVVHVPNGRNAGSARMGGFWKGQGVVSGMPDIMVFSLKYQHVKPQDGGGILVWAGYGLELKKWPGKPSDDQLAIHSQLAKNGFDVCVCYGLCEVEAITKAYFGK